jgi:hypothetical protein
MSAPRHRREPNHELPLRSYQPPVPLRSRDFDAVAPMRTRAGSSSSVATDQWAEEEVPSSLTTTEALYLAHS